MEVLQRYGNLSLRQRVSRIQRDFGLRVPYTTLRTFYRDHKVRFYKPGYVYNAAVRHRTALDLERYQWVAKLCIRLLHQ